MNFFYSHGHVGGWTFGDESGISTLFLFFLVSLD